MRKKAPESNAGAAFAAPAIANDSFTETMNNISERLGKLEILTGAKEQEEGEEKLTETDVNLVKCFLESKLTDLVKKATHDILVKAGQISPIPPYNHNPEVANHGN